MPTYTSLSLGQHRTAASAPAVTEGMFRLPGVTSNDNALLCARGLNLSLEIELQTASEGKIIGGGRDE